MTYFYCCFAIYNTSWSGRNFSGVSQRFLSLYVEEYMATCAVTLCRLSNYGVERCAQWKPAIPLLFCCHHCSQDYYELAQLYEVTVKLHQIPSAHREMFNRTTLHLGKMSLHTESKLITTDHSRPPELYCSQATAHTKFLKNYPLCIE